MPSAPQGIAEVELGAGEHLRTTTNTRWSPEGWPHVVAAIEAAAG